jgi:WD40 repeat protein
MGTVWDVEWAATGYYFLTGGADKMAILWRTDVPAPQRIFEHHGEVYKVNFLKNPDFVCTAGEEGIFRVWKVLTGECVRVILFLNVGNQLSLTNTEL